EGPGIPEDKKNNLFKPFGRTGVIKANGEKSTGLGLVISKKITEKHGGSIGAQNREQKGARFWFKIPAA
ncbi:MAG TPA: HAMP domain-containing sensor histidine kinase, partial [Candidatus Goldiibacteriota bacterium]|nr:HAMP domain-containing sensor histidine kinase [Candidatus Goldiibacteriota bacterium]